MSDYRELESKPVTARKHHICEWCAEDINIGDAANYRRYVFDRAMRYGWMHPECNAAMLEYPDQQDLADGWSAGDFERPRLNKEN